MSIIVKKADVENRLVAIDCIDPRTEKSRGCGTAFWCNLSGVSKVLTASHLAWNPHDNPQPCVIPGEKLTVKWKTAAGASGEVKARFNPHPNSQILDYVSLDFEQESLFPKLDVFDTCISGAKISDKVICAGFPGLFPNLNPPKVDFRIGIVEKLFNAGQILVAGSGDGGFSGGPAFFFVDHETGVGDCVVGLMSGRPRDDILVSLGLADGYLLTDAKCFV